MSPFLAGIVGIILLLVDGYIFGVAIRKGLVAVILIILGFILAGFIGLAIPYFTVTNFWNHFTASASSVISSVGTIIYAFPIAWIIGLVIGLVL
jgi:hypothetical protein